MSHIPSRWLQCPRVGHEVIEDVFLPLKTPLSDTFNEQVAPQHRFTPRMIFDHCKPKQVNIKTNFTNNLYT